MLTPLHNEVNMDDDTSYFATLLLRTLTVVAALVLVGINLMWWRVGLPYCISAHSDGLLLVAVAVSLLIIPFDVLAIGFGLHVYNKIEAAITETDNAEA